MSQLKEAVEALGDNPRLAKCNRLLLVRKDRAADAAAKVENYRRIEEWIELYYEKGYPFIGYTIESIMDNIERYGHKHQYKIDDDFNHMAKRLAQTEGTNGNK